MDVMNFYLFLVALKYPLHPHESIVIRTFHAYLIVKFKSYSNCSVSNIDK